MTKLIYSVFILDNSTYFASLFFLFEDRFVRYNKVDISNFKFMHWIYQL